MYFFPERPIIEVFRILPFSRTVSFHTNLLTSSVALHQPYAEAAAPRGVSTSWKLAHMRLHQTDTFEA